MNVERPELKLVRERLESVVAPSVAASALFDALAELGGHPPTTGEGVVEMVEGPLARALGKRMRKDDASEVVREIADAVRVVLRPSIGAPRGKFRDLEITLEVHRGTGAVPVLVLSGSDGFAARLAVALGPERVATRTIGDIETLTKLLAHRTPPIVLVDAMDFPSIEPVELAGLLERAPRGTIRAIWGADLAYGSVLLGELVVRQVPATPLDRREGIDPLLDLVRSRGVQPL